MLQFNFCNLVKNRHGQGSLYSTERQHLGVNESAVWKCFISKGDDAFVYLRAEMSSYLASKALENTLLVERQKLVLYSSRFR